LSVGGPEMAGGAEFERHTEAVWAETAAGKRRKLSDNAVGRTQEGKAGGREGGKAAMSFGVALTLMMASVLTYEGGLSSIWQAGSGVVPDSGVEWTYRRGMEAQALAAAVVAACGTEDEVKAQHRIILKWFMRPWYMDKGDRRHDWDEAADRTGAEGREQGASRGALRGEYGEQEQGAGVGASGERDTG
jgi:hypothetical protein